jgi:hypothetical protein
MVRAHCESPTNGAMLRSRGAVCPTPPARRPRPSSPGGFCFLGESHAYPNGQHVAGSRGSFYVLNPRRSLRKLAPGGPCPFCGWRAGIGLTAHACRLGGGAREGYMVADNHGR